MASLNKQAKRFGRILLQPVSSFRYAAQPTTPGSIWTIETLTRVPSPGLETPFLGGSGLQAGSEALLTPLPSPALGICWANWRHRHGEHSASRKASSFRKTQNAVLFVINTANLAHTGPAVGVQNKYTARISYMIRKRPKSAAYPNAEVSTWPTLPCQRKRSLLLEVKNTPGFFLWALTPGISYMKTVTFFPIF